ncbi:cytochrome [Edwardsiella tarda]|uniref:Cytochrome n=1 Tax=Edwardsiella tarda TaxID=636 RepID=A0A2A7U7A3_EDWTA|nr:cytochrome [Edwardsiella tarda]PEH74292.1 cytochrome [Edwardsiella tarda]
MNFNEMMAALSPKRESLTIQGYQFYARPMTVQEFNDHITNADKDARDELSILRCIEDEEGNPVFTDIKQVKQLYTTVRAELIGLVALATLMPEPSKVEKEVKKTRS